MADTLLKIARTTSNQVVDENFGAYFVFDDKKYAYYIHNEAPGTLEGLSKIRKTQFGSF